MNRPNTKVASLPQRREMTEEEKMMQRAQIYLQKKESYALNASLKLIETMKPTCEAEMEKIVNLADKFSDCLLETLFKGDENTEEGTDEANQ